MRDGDVSFDCPICGAAVGDCDHWKTATVKNGAEVRLKKLSPEAKIPEKANASDAAYDLVAVADPCFHGHFVEYRTGIAIELPPGYHALIHPRSSISKYDLMLCNSIGLLDNGYRGEIICRFKIIPSGPIAEGTLLNPAIYQKGDKIAQLLIEKTETFHFVEVEELSSTDRGSGAFGSSGK